MGLECHPPCPCDMFYQDGRLQCVFLRVIINHGWRVLRFWIGWGAFLFDTLARISPPLLDHHAQMLLDAPGFSLCLGPRLELSAASALRPRTWTSTYLDSLDIGLERLRPSIWLRCCLLGDWPQLQWRRVILPRSFLWEVSLLTERLGLWNSRQRRISRRLSKLLMGANLRNIA